MRSILAQKQLPVLLLGQTGCGKSHFARELHRDSKQEGPFVSTSLSSIATELIESELFGHEAGAFTGAQRQHRGLFEQASGGTLFLDEIGEITPAIQKKLLLVLEEREFKRVGGERSLKLNCKLVFATHRNLEELASKGEFRTDLYYRIRAHQHRIESLKERIGRDPRYVERFYEKLCDQGLKRILIDEDCLAWLNLRSWPGNLRQLKMSLEVALELLPSGARSIDLETMKKTVAESRLGSGCEGAVLGYDFGNGPLGAYHTSLEAFERQYFERALKEYGGRINQISRSLSVNKTTLLAKLRRYDMKAENYRTHPLHLLKACS